MAHDGVMTNDRNRPPITQDGRLLGWASGLSLLPAPWIVAGVISTFAPDPEATFPWAFALGFVVMTAWVGYGSWRIPGFRRGGVRGSAMVLGIFATSFGILLLMQP